VYGITLFLPSVSISLSYNWHLANLYFQYYYQIVCVVSFALRLPLIVFHRFGYNSAISQLLTVPPYVFASMFTVSYCNVIPSIVILAIVLYIFANFSDKLKMRSPFILAGLAMCLIGFVINISNVPNGVKYFGTFFVVAGAYAPFPGVVAWSVPCCSSNTLNMLIVLVPQARRQSLWSV
jgi:hypothetical protein